MCRGMEFAHLGKKALTPYGEFAISGHTPPLGPNSIPHQQVLQAQEDDVGVEAFGRINRGCQFVSHLHPFRHPGEGRDRAFFRAFSPAPAFAGVTVFCWISKAIQHPLLQAGA